MEEYQKLPAKRGLEAELAALRELERSGEETLLVWEAQDACAVLPRSGPVKAHLLSPEETPFLRRESGGGAVVVGPGCLNYALILSLERRPALLDVAHSYGVILGKVLAELSLHGARAICSDLVLGDRKFAGHAQRRTKRALLHHGTILYGFEHGLIGRWLREPARQPEYRRGRRHEDFLVNLPVEREALIDALARLTGSDRFDARP